jgi:hypothetical protein
MRTIGDIAELALDYIDITAGTSLLDGATPRQKKFLCSVMTGALQELHAKKPEAFRQRQGALLSGPESVTVGVTAGTTLADFSGSGRDMRGQSVRAGSIFNQVAPAAESPGTAFVMPWQGTTGSQSLRVYGDALLIGPAAFSVQGDVHLEGYGPLRPAPDRATYTASRDELWLEDYGRRAPSLSRPRWDGFPEVWWAEPAFIAGKRQQLYLRFAPLPDRAYAVEYDLAFLPMEIQVGDLEDTTTVLPIPGDFVDSILVPYVLWRWKGCPWFRNEAAKAEINAQYQVAKGMLQDWGAQVQQNLQVVVVGD